MMADLISQSLKIGYRGHFDRFCDLGERKAVFIVGVGLVEQVLQLKASAVSSQEQGFQQGGCLSSKSQNQTTMGLQNSIESAENSGHGSVIPGPICPFPPQQGSQSGRCFGTQQPTTPQVG